MMTRLTTASLALFSAAFLLTGCGEKMDAPAVEAPAVAEETAVVEESTDVETSAVMLENGAVKAAVVVEKSTPESDQAFIASTQVQTLTAKVVSIDLETLDVVLVGDDGVEIELVASEKTMNLDKVSPGDTVNAQFIEQVTIQLVKGDALQPQDISAQREVQAAEGEMPARAEIQKTVNVYTVVGINIEANTFVLQNAADEVEEFTARDPANLVKASVGDSVVVTTTEAMAVEVVKATAE
jgi:PBP1b-binding outer membrane lipoprotein LpoB